jgi:hypothetical protein
MTIASGSTLCESDPARPCDAEAMVSTMLRERVSGGTARIAMSTLAFRHLVEVAP